MSQLRCLRELESELGLVVVFFSGLQKMLSGNDSALSKEEARIQLKRAQNEKRKERFLSARTRLIGVDVDALDAQVAEMQRMKSDNKEADRVEREWYK